MTTHIVTPTDELEIIHLLAAGTRTTAQVAKRTGVAELIVCEVAKKHGWPHLGRIADSAEALRKELGQKEPGAELDEAATDAPTPSPTRVPPKPERAAQQPSGRSLADLRRRAEPWPHLLARVEYAAKKLAAVADSIAEAWADANGVECSRYGYIPKAVRAAYEEARR